MRRKLAANPNEAGEGRIAEEIADCVLAARESMRGADGAEQDRLMRTLEAQLKVIHEVAGKPQERVEHSESSARTIVVHHTVGDPTPPELPIKADVEHLNG